MDNYDLSTHISTTGGSAVAASTSFEDFRALEEGAAYAEAAVAALHSSGLLAGADVVGAVRLDGGGPVYELSESPGPELVVEPLPALPTALGLSSATAPAAGLVTVSGSGGGAGTSGGTTSSATLAAALEAEAEDGVSGAQPSSWRSSRRSGSPSLPQRSASMEDVVVAADAGLGGTPSSGTRASRNTADPPGDNTVASDAPASPRSPRSEAARCSPCAISSDNSLSNCAADADLALQFCCPICLEVCEEAVETPCCNNLFCHRCLLAEEHRIERCPICKSALRPDHVRPNVPVRRIVSDLPCTCRFEACGAKLRRRDRARHEEQCDFMPVRCRFSTACPPLLRGQAAWHEAEECPHRPIECPLGCGGTVAFLFLDAHLRQACPRGACTCEHCEASICRADLGEHLRVHCPLAPVICGFAEEETQACCEHRCERRLLPEHHVVCPFRPATCRHDGCRHVTTARLLESHEDNCHLRRISCPDCGTDVCLGALQLHLEKECPDHIVSCPFEIHGCTELVPRRLVADHLRCACSDHVMLLANALALRDLQVEALRIELTRVRDDYEMRIARLERGRDRSTLPALRVAPIPLATALPPVAGGDALPLSVPPPTPPPPPPPPPPLPPNVPDSRPASMPDGSSDMFPSLPWDQDPGISLPGPLQPLTLLREGGVSQAPVLAPRIHGGRGTPGFTQGTLFSDIRNVVRPNSHMQGPSLGGPVGYRSAGAAPRDPTRSAAPPPPPSHYALFDISPTAPSPSVSEWLTPLDPPEISATQSGNDSTAATNSGGDSSPSSGDAPDDIRASSPSGPRLRNQTNSISQGAILPPPPPMLPPRRPPLDAMAESEMATSELASSGHEL